MKRFPQFAVRLNDIKAVAFNKLERPKLPWQLIHC